MANIRLCDVQLPDNWPGEADQHLGVPANGWDNTKDNFVTTSADGTDAKSLGTYPMGTKIKAYTDNTNCPGWYTMMYLGLHCATATEANASICAEFSDTGFMCSHVGMVDASHTMFSEGSVAPYYILGTCFTTNSSDLTQGGPVAIPCATHGPGSSDQSSNYTLGYGDSFGWFWVGGVCPCKDATIMDDTQGSLRGIDLTASAERGPNWCGTLADAYPLIVNESTVGVQFYCSVCAQ